MSELLPQRTDRLRAALSEAKPEAVVFYGLNYAHHWEEIAGIEIHRDKHGFGTARRGTTSYALAPHPIARGISNQQFEELGVVAKLGKHRQRHSEILKLAEKSQNVRDFTL